MNNVAPSRAISRRARLLLQLAAVLTALGIFIATIGVALFVVPLTSDSSGVFGVYDFARNITFIGGVLIAFAGLGVAVRALTLKTENNLARMVGDYLVQNSTTIDNRYTFIRNINKRGIGYVDAVLVGQSGVLVFRVTDITGQFLNEKGRWLRKNDRGELETMRFNPTHDAVADMRKIREYLEMREFPNVSNYLFGIVVFVRDDVILETRQPVIPATELKYLPLRLDDGFLAKTRIDQNKVDAIVNVLYDR